MNSSPLNSSSPDSIYRPTWETVDNQNNLAKKSDGFLAKVCTVVNSAKRAIFFNRQAPLSVEKAPAGIDFVDVLVVAKEEEAKQSFPARQEYAAVEASDLQQNTAEEMKELLDAGHVNQTVAQALSDQLNSRGKLQPVSARLCNKKVAYGAAGFSLLGSLAYWLAGEKQAANIHSPGSAIQDFPVSGSAELGPRTAELKIAPDVRPGAAGQPLNPTMSPFQTPNGITVMPISLQPTLVSASTIQKLIFEDQTRRLQSLLLTAAVSEADRLHNDSELHLKFYQDQQLKPLRSLASQVINFLNQNDDNASLIAAQLLASKGEYGSGKNETISAERKMAVINDWLMHAVLGKPLEQWVLEQVKDMQKRDYSLFHHAHLQRRLFNLINSSTKQGKLTPVARKFLQEQVIANALPTLLLKGQPELAKKDITQPPWGFEHAGTLLLREAGADLKGLSAEEITEAGMLLDILLRQEALPAEWMEYFRLPALIHEAWVSEKARPVKIAAQNTAKSYPQYAEFAEQWLRENNPFLHFSYEAERWKTRPELALQQLEKHRVPGKWLNNYLNQRGATEYIVKKERVTLPDIDNLFDQQNERLAGIFYQTDIILLPAAFSQLDDEEQRFIASADIRRVHARFDASKKLYGVPLSPAVRQGMQNAKALKYPLPDSVDLLECKRGDEKHIYALEKDAETGGYSVRCVDEREDMLALLADSKVPRSDSDYELIITHDQPLKATDETQEQLIDKLASLHRTHLRDALKAEGYVKTTEQKIKEFFLSLVPFYDCIERSRRGDEQAFGACMLDIANIIPFFGQAGKVGINFSLKLGSAAEVALRRAVAQATLNQMMKEGGKQFIKQFPRIAEEISPAVIREMGVSLARSIDPGVEILASGGVKGIQALQNILTRLENKGPALLRLAEALEKRGVPAAVQPVREIANGSMIKKEAFDPLLNKEVQIAQVGRDESGRELWVRVHPETGELAGKRYYLEAGGMLVSAPVNLGGRLYRQAQQGLGGRGAPKAAAENPGLKRPPAVDESESAKKSRLSPDEPGTSGSAVVENLAIPGTSGKTVADIVARPGTSGKAVAENLAIPGTSGKAVAENLAIPGTSGKTVADIVARPGTSGKTVAENLAIPGTSGQSATKELAAPKTAGKSIVAEATSWKEQDYFINGIPVKVFNVGEEQNICLLYPEAANILLVKHENNELKVYPQVTGMELRQEELDATEYERAVAALTKKQRDGLRTWTAIESSSGFYSNGERVITDGHNYEVNDKKSTGEKLTPAEQNVYDALSEVYEKNLLPTVKGDFVRVSEYFAGMRDPWGDGAIVLGDYVTNAERIMSVSSGMDYAKAIAADASGISEAFLGKRKRIVTYFFVGLEKAVPLLPLAVSKSGKEFEHTIGPGQIFKVEALATSYPWDRYTDWKYSIFTPRASATLRQVVDPEELNKITEAKNIHTGRLVYFDRKAEKPDEPGPSGSSLK